MSLWPRFSLLPLETIPLMPHSLLRPALLRTVVTGVAGVATLGAVGISGPATSGATPAPATAPNAAAAERTTLLHSERVPATAQARRSGSDAVAALDRTATPGYSLLAVTWDHGTAPQDLAVSVRSRVAGVWTEWQPLPVDLDEGPSEAEEPDVRDGTAPGWAGQADGVAVRLTSATGRAPTGVKVVTIDPAGGDAGTESTRTLASSSPSSGDPILQPPAFPAIPDVMTRKEWGADPTLGDTCWEPRYGKSAKMVFVHHTVNSNDYSASEGPEIVRGIHAYHTQSRGWCDIGYNFLVDRFGQIYEGRRGGMRMPVRGAHAGDYNTNTVGISMIGDFDIAKVPAEMKNAIVRLVGWRLGTSYMPAKGKIKVNGARFNRIAGHRDAMSTACPGRYGYAWLPKLRDRVAEYLSRFDSTIEAKRDRLGRKVTGQVFIGELNIQDGRRTQFGKGAMFAKAGAGTHWLSGRALQAYRDRNGTYGRLGFPSTDRRDTAVAGVSTVRFEHGRIYLVPQQPAYTLWGRILLRYGNLGSVTSDLGLPVSSVISTTTGQYAKFQHGTIRWDAATGDVTVEYR